MAVKLPPKWNPTVMSSAGRYNVASSERDFVAKSCCACLDELRLCEGGREEGESIERRKGGERGGRVKATTQGRCLRDAAASSVWACLRHRGAVRWRWWWWWWRRSRRRGRHGIRRGYSSSNEQVSSQQKQQQQQHQSLVASRMLPCKCTPPQSPMTPELTALVTPPPPLQLSDRSCAVLRCTAL